MTAADAKLGVALAGRRPSSETVRGLAEGSGLRPGDRVLSVNGVSVTDTPDAVAKLVAAPAGAVVVAIEPGLRRAFAPGAHPGGAWVKEMSRPEGAVDAFMGLGLRIQLRELLGAGRRRLGKRICYRAYASCGTAARMLVPTSTETFAG